MSFLEKQIWGTKIIRDIDAFIALSGLKMNLDKSVLFPLKDCSSTEIENIQVKYYLTSLCSNL